MGYVRKRWSQVVNRWNLLLWTINSVAFSAVALWAGYLYQGVEKAEDLSLWKLLLSIYVLQFIFSMYYKARKWRDNRIFIENVKKFKRIEIVYQMQ